MFAINESVEMARLTLIIGFAVALFFKKRFGFNPGGIVVPAFLVFMFDKSPLLALVCLLSSFIIYYVYKAVFGKKAFSQRLVALIHCFSSVIIMIVLALLFQRLNLLPSTRSEEFFGFVIPGLIALSYRSSGIINTLEGILFSSLVTYAISVLIFLIFLLVPNVDIGELSELRNGRPIYEIPYYYAQILVSMLIAMFAYLINKSRVGGFIVLPIIASLVFDLPNLLLFLASLALSYVLVVKVLTKFTMIYGLTRFVTLAAVSMIIVWGAEYYLLLNTDTSFSPFLGSTNLAPLAVTVMANDMAIQGVKKSISPFVLASVVMVIFNVLIRMFLLKI